MPAAGRRVRAVATAPSREKHLRYFELVLVATQRRDSADGVSIALVGRASPKAVPVGSKGKAVSKNEYAAHGVEKGYDKEFAFDINRSGGGGDEDDSQPRENPSGGDGGGSGAPDPGKQGDTAPSIGPRIIEDDFVLGESSESDLSLFTPSKHTPCIKI